MSWPIPGEQPKISWGAIPNNTALLGMWPIGIRGEATKRNGKRYLPAAKLRALGKISISEFSPCYAHINNVWHEIEG